MKQLLNVDSGHLNERSRCQLSVNLQDADGDCCSQVYLAILLNLNLYNTSSDVIYFYLVAQNALLGFIRGFSKDASALIWPTSIFRKVPLFHHCMGYFVDLGQLCCQLFQLCLCEFKCVSLHSVVVSLGTIVIDKQPADIR